MMMHIKIHATLCINKKVQKIQKEKDERCKKDAKLKFKTTLEAFQKGTNDVIISTFTITTLFVDIGF